MSSAQRLLALLVVLSGAAVVLRTVSRRSRVPYQVVLAVGGILIGLVPGGRTTTFAPDLILLAFVPSLVFEAALTLRLDQLRRLLAPVALLATAGVIVMVVGFAALVHVLVHFSWSDSFLLGAILAPTDPIAVVSVLRAIRAPVRMTTLLEGESLFNDATGVAVFAAILASLTSGRPSLADVGVRFLITTGIGLVVGLVWGGLALVALRSTAEAPLEFLTTLTLAYGAYLTADVAHGSGIIAVVTAAVTVVLVQRRVRLHDDQLLEFWGLAGFILNALVFLLIGTALPAAAVLGVLGSIVIGFLVLTAVRALIVPVFLLATARQGQLSRSAWPLVVWGGMRGALSVALALSTAGHAGVGQDVIAIAYGIVVLSLLVQGGTVRPASRLLRLANTSQ